MKVVVKMVAIEGGGGKCKGGYCSGGGGGYLNGRDGGGGCGETIIIKPIKFNEQPNYINVAF